MKNHNKIKKSKRKSLLTNSLIISVTILICMLCSLIVSYGYSQKIFNEERTKQLNQYAQLQANLSAQKIEQYLSSLDSDIRFFTEKKYVLEGFLSNDRDRRNIIAKQVIEKIESNVKNNVAIRYFAMGEAKVNRSIDPPIRFSDVDMIRNLEKGQEVYPEAYTHNKRWLMTYVTPVLTQGNVSEPTQTDTPVKETSLNTASSKDKSNVLGVFMVVVDIEDLFLQLAKENEGLVVLTQRFGDSRPVTIHSTGHGELMDKGSVEIKNSYWTVTYTPSEKAFKHVYFDRSQTFIVVAIFVVLSTLFGYFLGKILRQFGSLN